MVAFICNRELEFNETFHWQTLLFSGMLLLIFKPNNSGFKKKKKEIINFTKSTFLNSLVCLSSVLNYSSSPAFANLFVFFYGCRLYGAANWELTFS